MDGFECLADIRSFQMFLEIEIVVYSSSYRAREVNQLIRDGANQYIKKPILSTQLEVQLYESFKLY